MLEVLTSPFLKTNGAALPLRGVRTAGSFLAASDDALAEAGVGGAVRKAAIKV